jgi:hypothetical protein
MLKVQAVFERASALPEDRVINTFTFQDGVPAAPPGNAADAIRAALDDFYFLNTAAGSSIRTFLASTLKSLSYRFYNSLDPEPREAIVRPSLLFTQPAVGAQFPAEVCLVASFFAVRNLPRLRGRIYLGPVTASAQGGLASTDVDSRPSAAFLTTVAQAMARLRSAPNLDATRWSVGSTVDGIERPVTSGWVDNAWDTQRRRGGKSSARTLMP